MTGTAATPAAWREVWWLRRLARGGGAWPAVPAVLYLVVMMVLPLCVLFSFGFVTIERGRVVPGSFTLEHYRRILADPLSWLLFWRSFWIGAVSTALCLALGYPLAYLYTVLGSLGRKILLVAVISPLLTSALVRTYAWLVILGGRRGLLNTLLLSLGLIDTPVRILNTDLAVLVGMTQIHLPFMILPLMAVLAARDRFMEEASLNLGASRVQTFFRVVVPLSLPGIGAGTTLVFAVSYTNFIIPQLLGGGNYSTVAVKVYEQTIVILDWATGAVLAALLLVSCFVFVFLITYATDRLTAWSERSR
ncbi:MAG TPA: ABC transporter permease [Methylomirabilota bacterium]|jgi:putative spermidine/putrescine transport system permease protein|nr:ABC transporter permease [Methylomirabilota bacterium]